MLLISAGCVRYQPVSRRGSLDSPPGAPIVTVGKTCAIPATSHPATSGILVMSCSCPATQMGADSRATAPQRASRKN